MKPTSFTLGEHERSFIDHMVEQGRFGNRTEVVRAGLRLLEDYETSKKLERLRSLIAEGDRDIDTSNVSSFENPESLVQHIMNK
ncbi:MAG: type II toxin-antitoxin system ParD family antitoxin [Bacteroidota bacterium]